MASVIVVGGGLSGCAAAAAAARAGAATTLIERAEVLGGWGLLAGVVDHKYFPVREELKLMGGYDIFQVIDGCTLHRDVKFPWPGPNGAMKDLYDATKLGPGLRQSLEKIGVKVKVQCRATDVVMKGNRIEALVLNDGSHLSADAFVDATGGAGGVSNCRTYGRGCAMCFQRCPAFGDRVSIAAKAGVKELKGKKRDGTYGPTNSAYALFKESLSAEIRQELERNGIICIPIPKALVNYERTRNITASANIDAGFAENALLVDIGFVAKRIAGGYTPLEELRRIPGLENAIYAEPFAGTIGNAVRYMALTPRDEALRVKGIANLFVASEKVGINGIGEAIVPGVVAGHNAARNSRGLEPLVLPRTTMVGGFIAFGTENWDKEEWLCNRFTLYGGPFCEFAEKTGLYSEDPVQIKKRIVNNSLEGILLS